jgi:flagellin-like protein
VPNLARHPSREGVSPVIAVILLVAITVVLAAVVYISATQLAQNQRPTPVAPMVIVSQSSTEVVVRIADITESSLSVSKFQAVLLVNGTVDEASRIRPLDMVTRGNLTFQSTDDTLNGGDSLLVSVVPDREYRVALVFLQTGEESGSTRIVT